MPTPPERPGSPPDPGRASRLSRKQTRWLVTAFLAVVLCLTLLASYLIHTGRNNPELQETYDRIRRSITPPGGSSRDFARRDSLTAPDSADAPRRDTADVRP